MKKTLLVIAFTLLIFCMIVLATAIDVGPGAINRTSTMSSLYTRVMKENPANDTGTITSIELWSFTDLAGCEVATFYVVSGDNLSTRDTHYIGNVTGGSKQTFSGLSLSVEAGDYIGVRFTGGTIEGDTSSAFGMWYKNGDYIPCTDETFSSHASGQVSIYGIGETAPTFPIAKFGGVTITKWNTKEITKWNTIP